MKQIFRGYILYWELITLILYLWCSTVVWCFNRMRVSRMADLARRVLSIQSHVVRWLNRINILNNIKIYLEMCSCDWKLLRLCFGFFNVTVFLSVVMLETSRPPSLCNCLTLRQGPKLPLEGINPIFCTLLMLWTLIFQFTTFCSRWTPSTLFSFQTILVMLKASVARLRPWIQSIKPFIIPKSTTKNNQTKTIKYLNT